MSPAAFSIVPSASKQNGEDLVDNSRELIIVEEARPLLRRFGEWLSFGVGSSSRGDFLFRCSPIGYRRVSTLASVPTARDFARGMRCYRKNSDVELLGSTGLRLRFSEAMSFSFFAALPSFSAFWPYPAVSDDNGPKLEEALPRRDSSRFFTAFSPRWPTCSNNQPISPHRQSFPTDNQPHRQPSPTAN